MIKNSNPLATPYTALQFLLMNSSPELRQQSSRALAVVKARLDLCTTFQATIANLENESKILQNTINDLKAELSTYQFQTTEPIKDSSTKTIKRKGKDEQSSLE